MARAGSCVSGAAAFVALGVWITACTDGARVTDAEDAPTPSPFDGVGAAGEGSEPRTVRVLLASTSSSGGGTAGASGASGAAGISESSGTNASYAPMAMAGNAGMPSAYCGDGRRNPTNEECDDGNGSPGAFCNWACQLQDNWATHSPPAVPLGGRRVLHQLGRGRHPLAANENRFAVAVLEQVTPTEQVVTVTQYDDVGIPILATNVSFGTWVADQPDPVVAVLASGDIITAYTEFGGDGDGLGIALSRLRAGQNLPDSTTWASNPPFAAQYDADILALTDRVIVAYTDENDATTGPDITVREFNLDLTPRSTTALGATSGSTTGAGGRFALGATSDVEGRVALAKVGDSWGAAWRRALADGTEVVEVFDQGTNTHWSIGPHTASDSEDQPALVALDATRRLVLYARDEAAPTNQIAMTGKLYFAVLDTAQPGSPISNNPIAVTAGYTYSSLSQRQPALQSIGTDAYMAWSTGQRTSDPSFVNAEEIWYQRITPTLAASPTFGLSGEQTIPRWATELVNDQRAPALAMLGPSANQPGGALLSAWEDYGESLGANSAEPEVVVQMAPLPILRSGTTPARDCTVAAPCGPGQGRCTANNQCQSPLVCSTKNGPNFGYAPNIGVCVPAHCADNVLNGGETLVDCGGTDCGACLCGDGIPSPELGEACDTAGNSATCDNDCTLPVCGDGLLNTAAGEQCDLGAGNGPNAACLSNCTIPPVCTNGANCLSVWSKSQGSSSNQIGVFIRIVNNSTVPKSLNGITLRYWFTGDGVSNYTLACDSPGTVISNCSAITGAFSNFSPIRLNADRLMTITLNTTATLAPGANTGDMQLRFTKVDSTPTIQTNDYSRAAATLTANTAIGMYSNGTMIWGVEPTANFACGNAITEPGEACDNAANTNCNGTCSGFNIVNGKACTNSAQCLHVEQYSNDSATDGQVRPYFRIVNSGGITLALNRMKLKYWLTARSSTNVPPTTAGLIVGCTAGPGGNCGHMTVGAATITPTYTTADSVVTVTFASASTIQLGNTDTTNSMQFNLNRSDWLNMPETNDWSQTQSTTMVAAPKFALYVDNQLWWGEEAK